MITKSHSCALIFVFLLPTYSCSFPYAVPNVPVWFSFTAPHVSVFSFFSGSCFSLRLPNWSLCPFLFVRLVPGRFLGLAHPVFFLFCLCIVFFVGPRPIFSIFFVQ